MLKNLLSAVKGEISGDLIEKVGLPANKIDDVLEITGNVATKEVTKEATKGGLGNVMNMFSKSENNSGASSLQDNIVKGVVANLISKLGLDEAKANMAANIVVPMVMKQITGKNSETADDDASPINNLFGLGGSKKKSGIMGKVNKFF